MSKTTRILTVTAMIAFLTVPGREGGVHAEQATRAPESLLLGSWSVRIQEGPGTPDLPDWYKALVTFSPGGGLVATITDALLKTGHGTWVKTGNRRFAVTILLFQFDSAGNFLGTLKARATLKVNRPSDTFDSDDYQFEFFDPDGNPTGFVGVGTAHGTRIKAEPLR